MIIDALLERKEIDKTMVSRWQHLGYLDEAGKPTALLQRLRRTMLAGGMLPAADLDAAFPRLRPRNVP